MRLPLALLAAAVCAPAQPLAITHFTLIDTETGRARPDIPVIIAGDRITGVTDARRARIPAGAQVIDGRGKFLIPGLWDMHVHLVFGDWFPNAQAISLPLFVANGVTGVRDMGSELAIVRAMAQGD